MWIITRFDLAFRRIMAGAEVQFILFRRSLTLYVYSLLIVTMFYFIALITRGGSTSFWVFAGKMWITGVSFYCATLWATIYAQFWVTVRLGLKAFNGIVETLGFFLGVLGRHPAEHLPKATDEDLKSIKYATAGFLTWLLFFLEVVWMTPVHRFPPAILVLWVLFVTMGMRQEGWRERRPKLAMALAAFLITSGFSYIFMRFMMPETTYEIYGDKLAEVYRAEIADNGDGIFSSVDHFCAAWIRKFKGGVHNVTPVEPSAQALVAARQREARKKLPRAPGLLSQKARTAKGIYERMKYENRHARAEDQVDLERTCHHVTEQDLSDPKIEAICGSFQTE